LNKEHDGFQLVDANADDLLLQIVAQPSHVIQGSVWLDTLPTEMHMDFFCDKVGLSNYRFSFSTVVCLQIFLFIFFKGFWPSPPSFCTYFFFFLIKF